MSKQYNGKVLRGNAATSVPKFIISVDTETIPESICPHDSTVAHNFRLGVAMTARRRDDVYDGIQTYRFTKKESFWNLLYGLTSPQHTVWLVAHNTLFDLVVLGMPEQFEQAKLVIDCPRSKRKREDNDEDNAHAYGLCVLESPPTIIGMKCTETQGRIVAVDTLNWLQCPLSRLGDNLGLPKHKMPTFTEDDETWFNYCERDCEITIQSFIKLIEWVKKNDFGMFRYTGAAQSMAAFRHRFTRVPIYIHTEKDAKKLERSAYYGGRIEVFKRGKIEEDVYVLDVNSLFPSVMQHGFFPKKLANYAISSSYIELMPNIHWQSSIAECLIETNEPIYPLRTKSRTVYPIGRFRVTLCGKELAHAILRKHVKAVRSYAEYDCENLFTEFVTELYEMRMMYKEAGDELYCSFVKSILNSLYGKFAQLAPRWVPDHKNYSGLPWSQWTEIDIKTGEKTKFRCIGWNVFKNNDREEKQNTFVAISAFITSAARVRMNHLRCTAGATNVYYQGVDGLVVTRNGYQRLAAAGEIDEKEIGKLRVVLQTNEGEIYGCADYRVGGKVVVAGRYGGAIQLENDTYSVRRFMSERDLFCGTGDQKMMEFRSLWHRTGDYPKGVIGDDGWVSPIEINEDNQGPLAASASADKNDSAIESILTSSESSSPPPQLSTA